MPSPSLSDTIYTRLVSSPFFAEYEKAFSLTVGMTMRLLPADPNAWGIKKNDCYQSPFCQQLNTQDGNPAPPCAAVNKDLMELSALEGKTSCNCFAGLMTTSIPIFAGTMIVGYLKTGQVFQNQPSQDNFEAALEKLQNALNAIDREKLRKAYFSTQVIDPKRYEGIVTLLSHFANELSMRAEKLAISSNEEEPEAISKARDYIRSQLSEALTLSDIAKVAGMSESHFCRQFKISTGMTLTEYINYSRILWVKKELLNPSARISEIAFKVGFQSLSQFNRCFTKFHGSSPSRYREEVGSRQSALS